MTVSGAEQLNWSLWCQSVRLVGWLLACGHLQKLAWYKFGHPQGPPNLTLHLICHSSSRYCFISLSLFYSSYQSIYLFIWIKVTVKLNHGQMECCTMLVSILVLLVYCHKIYFKTFPLFLGMNTFQKPLVHTKFKMLVDETGIFG